MLADIERPRQAGIVRADGFVADIGHEPELQREDDLAHQRDPEQRRCVEGQSQRGDQTIRPFAGPARGERAHRGADDERDEKGRAGQQQCRRQALHDQAEHRLLLTIAEAEIEGEIALQIDPELGQEGLIETEARAQLFEQLRIGGAGLAGQHLRGIAGCGADQQEVQHGDGEEHDDALHEPAGEELREVHSGLS